MCFIKTRGSRVQVNLNRGCAENYDDNSLLIHKISTD